MSNETTSTFGRVIREIVRRVVAGCMFPRLTCNSVSEVQVPRNSRKAWTSIVVILARELVDLPSEIRSHVRLALCCDSGGMKLEMVMDRRPGVFQFLKMSISGCRVSNDEMIFRSVSNGKSKSFREIPGSERPITSVEAIAKLFPKIEVFDTKRVKYFGE